MDLLVVLDHYDPAGAIELHTRARRAADILAPFDERMTAGRHTPGAIELAVVLDGRCLHRGG